MKDISDFEYLLIESKLIECKQLINNILKEHRVIKIVRVKSGNRFYFANRVGVTLRIMYSSKFRCMRIVDNGFNDDILRIYFKELKTENYWHNDKETYYNVFCKILEKILKLPIELKP